MKKAPIYVGSVVTLIDPYRNGVFHGEMLTVVELRGRFAMCVRDANIDLSNIPTNVPRHKINKTRLVVVTLPNNNAQ